MLKNKLIKTSFANLIFWSLAGKFKNSQKLLNNGKSWKIHYLFFEYPTYNSENMILGKNIPRKRWHLAVIPSTLENFNRLYLEKYTFSGKNV